MMKYSEAFSNAEFIEVTPKEVLSMQESPNFYMLTWYPPNINIRDNEIGFYLIDKTMKRVIIK